MALDGARRRRSVSLVPNSHLLVITDREERIDIEIIPCDVFNDRRVRLEVCNWILRQLVAIGGIDVPDAHVAIVAARQEQTMLMLVPCEAIALLRVT